jgi:hypothetical protein
MRAIKEQKACFSDDDKLILILMSRQIAVPVFSRIVRIKYGKCLLNSLIFTVFILKHSFYCNII